MPSWGPWSRPTRQHQLPWRIRKLATKDFLRGSKRRVQFTVILWMDVGESITMFFSDFIQLWFFFLDITTAIQPSVTVEILVMLFISFIYMCVIKWSSYQAQVHFTEDTLGRVRYRYDMSECEQVMLFIWESFRFNITCILEEIHSFNANYYTSALHRSLFFIFSQHTRIFSMHFFPQLFLSTL